MSATRKVRPDAGGPREADNYPTPAWAVAAIVPEVRRRMPHEAPRIYDAGAGGGAILDGFRTVGVALDLLYGCDIRDEAAMSCRDRGLMVWTQDWLTVGPAYAGNIGAIVMNPPYGGRENTAQRFVDVAIRRLERPVPEGGQHPCVWALLRVNWLIDGQATHLRTDWLRGVGMPDVYALNRRPSFTGDGKADAATYAWMCWPVGRRAEVGRFTIIDCCGTKDPK